MYPTWNVEYSISAIWLPGKLWMLLNTVKTIEQK